MKEMFLQLSGLLLIIRISLGMYENCVLICKKYFQKILKLKVYRFQLFLSMTWNSTIVPSRKRKDNTKL